MKLSATTKTAVEAPGKLLDWDTEFWGLRVGGASRTEGLAQWAIDNTIGLMCLLVDADSPDEAAKAESLGYRYMDTRVTLSRKTASCGSGSRLARVEDVPKLQEIARSSHRITRFYADERLPQHRCDDLYDEWIRRSFAGWADIVLVAERDEKVCGYVTVHLNKPTSSIGLIAVDESFRERGVGSELVSSAANWAHGQQATEMTIVTQGRNIPAQRLFQRCGFRTTKTELWFHKWYEEGK